MKITFPVIKNEVRRINADKQTLIIEISAENSDTHIELIGEVRYNTTANVAKCLTCNDEEGDDYRLVYPDHFPTPIKVHKVESWSLPKEE